MAEATVSDKFAQVRSFQVDITGATGKDVDTAWETCSGGQLMIEQTETTIGNDKFHTTTPGHKYIDVINLRGPMTAGRKALCQWIQATVDGKDWKRTVTITVDLSDGTAGKQFIYTDCFPVRYAFPRIEVLDAKDPGCDVELMEEVTFTYRSMRESP